MISNNFLSSPLAIENREEENINQEKFWLRKKLTYIGQQACYLANSLIRKIRNLSLLLLKHSILNCNTSLAKVFTVIVADVNEHPKDELSCLQYACGRNLKGVVQALLKKGADVNEECVLGPCQYTPLFWAVDRKDSEIIELLHQQGADVNKLCDNKSLLMRALEDNNLDIAKQLIKLGADPNLGNKRSDSSTSPLSECIERSYSEEEKVKQIEWLLSQKANPNIGFVSRSQKKDFSGQILSESSIQRIPLFSLITSTNISFENYLPLIKLLLEKGADPNKGYLSISSKNSDTFHSTPLQEVISSRKLLTEQKKQILDLLFQYKAQADYQAVEDDRAPGFSLFLAIKEKDSELVELLLKNGADAKTCGHYLLNAAKYKPAKINELLKNYGAESNGKQVTDFLFWPHMKDLKYI